MKLTSALATATLLRRLLGSPDASDPFAHLSLPELVIPIPVAGLARTLRDIFHDPLVGRGPWTPDEVAGLIAITTSQPGSRAALDLPDDSRLAPAAIDHLLKVFPATSPWLLYALSTSHFSDDQFATVAECTKLHDLRNQTTIAPYLRMQVTSFPRLLDLASYTVLSPITNGQWSDRLLVLPRSQADLVALAPHLRPETAARLLLRSDDATYPRATRATLHAYHALIPELPIALAQILTGLIGHRPPRTPAPRSEITRLLLHVPGLVPHFRFYDDFASSQLHAAVPSLYRLATRQLITRLLQLASSPAVTARLVENFSATLSQALVATNLLVAA